MMLIFSVCNIECWELARGLYMSDVCEYLLTSSSRAA